MKKRLSPLSRARLYFAKAMGVLILTCEKVTRLTSDSMEEKLPLKRRIGVKIHLVFCVWCRRNQKQLQLIRDIIRGHTTKIEDSKLDSRFSLSSEAKDRLQRAIKR